MKPAAAQHLEAQSAEPRRMKFLLHEDLYRAIALRAEKQRISHRCVIEDALLGSFEEELLQLQFDQVPSVNN